MYKEWIKELKVGDEVFVRNAGGYRMTLHKVQSIISAPITGPIIVVDNLRQKNLYLYRKEKCLLNGLRL